MYIQCLGRARFGLALMVGLGFAFAISMPALAQSASVTLFKIITAKDDIEIGLTDGELSALGDGPAIDALAKKLADAGQMTVWQYAVQRAPDGSGMVHAPLKRVAVFKTDTLRIEPFNPAPLKAVPPGPSQ